MMKKYENSGFTIYATLVFSDTQIFDGNLLKSIKKTLREHVGKKADLDVIDCLRSRISDSDVGEFIDHPISITLSSEEGEKKVEISFYKLNGYVLVELTIPSFICIESKTSTYYPRENIDWFINLFKSFCEKLNPIFGYIDEEFKDYDPINFAKHKTLPLDHAFYSRNLVDSLGEDELKDMLRYYYDYIFLRTGGIFFRLTKWEAGLSEQKASKKNTQGLKNLVNVKISKLQ